MRKKQLSPVRPRRRPSSAPSPLSLAREFRSDLDAGAYPHQLALARAHKIAPSVVTRHLALLRMPVALQRLVERGLRLQTAARIHALPIAEANRVIQGLGRGESFRSLLGQAKRRAPREPQRGDQTIREAFAAKLQAARFRAGLTQQELARALGVAQSTVGSWETAISIPEIVTLVRAADVLSVSIDWLFGRVASGGVAGTAR